MKATLSIIIFILFNQFLYSQSDCIKPFKYSGEIKIKNFNVQTIILPRTNFLAGYRKFDEIGGFIKAEPETDYFEIKTGTNLSSEFCGKSEEIIRNFFKKVKNYPIIIIEKMKDNAGKHRTLKFEIPVDKMIFKTGEDGLIEIIYPKIE